MDFYTALRFLHIMGFVFIGGGLLAVFVSEWRGYAAVRPVIFAEAAHYTAILYDFVVVPGAVMVLVSGPLLIWQVGYGYFDTPWLTAMWGLFLFEFIEGNTITRMQFQRTLKISRAMPEGGPLTRETRDHARTLTGKFTHFLDIPLFSVIVFCGVVRPDSWLPIGVAIGLAIAATLVLMFVVPRAAAATTAVAP